MQDGGPEQSALFRHAKSDAKRYVHHVQMTEKMEWASEGCGLDWH
jgi:hypothetical protein